MVHLLKNKADFYHLLDTLPRDAGTHALTDAFRTPDYRIAAVDVWQRITLRVLCEIETLYTQAGLAGRYPLGLLLRAAESEGNRGSCLVFEHARRITVVQTGKIKEAKGGSQTASFAHWADALQNAQQRLVAIMNTEKEDRVIISRYLDVMDSPGMSVFIVDRQAASRGWNGTSTYPPSDS
ncbi:hypothetical protein [Ktedonospora formicarum]|uniref:Uncharacterized protein n=1 Tax=Ktedonospora formicarum TaxID=2778364 RepID=A0A8J3IAV9_9CHLR|nr:hypothetical protein [Ktedonospora formicarum]GHO48918.1 hypothetical protein KSX_70810 [Ktedonospora formicarum]